MTKILGISAYYHDSAAALLNNGEIISAVQEERFTRIRHDASYPRNSINYILKENKINFNDIDYVVFYDKPLLKFERLLETYLSCAPVGFRSFNKSMPVWLREKLFLKKLLYDELKGHDKGFKDINKIHFSEHHFSHAASAFYPSPFKEAVVLTIDGVGEWATSTIAIGKDQDLKIKKEINFPHSIGLLYSAFTYYLGFKVNSSEYKVMGLAPYGTPKYKNLILENLVDLKDDGSFRLDMNYFNYLTGLTMTNNKFSKLFGKPVRTQEEPLTKFHMDIACSIQSVTEEILLKIAKFLKKEYEIPYLCLAGGVALNCVTNGKILKENLFKDIWIQPASGDAGGSIGAALALWHHELKNKRKIYKNDGMKGSYLGPIFSQDEIEKTLRSEEANFETLSKKAIIEKTVNEIIKGKVIGWFQGRMEFGPRALGNRSIIADARSNNMQKILNLKVKYREDFRPFAPSILIEDLPKWFELECDSPYMLLVANINKQFRTKNTDDYNLISGFDKLKYQRSTLPAITHVDYSARIQTVHQSTNAIFHELISYFKKETECPVLINTSFNVRGEPIVCSPKDAFKCFMGTEIDILVCGNSILYKEKQDSKLKKNYKLKYALD